MVSSLVATLFVCVYVHVNVWCICGGQRMSGVLLYHSLPYYLKMGTFTEQAKEQDILQSLSQTAKVTGMYVVILGFCVGAGIPTWVLILSQ